MNMHLSESLNNADIAKNRDFFARLCRVNHVNIVNRFKLLIVAIYAVNIAIESLQRDIANKICIEYISYDHISNNLNNNAVRARLETMIHKKKTCINIACREVELVSKLISSNLSKYLTILSNAEKMGVYVLI